MNLMDEQFEAMKAALEAAGGQVGFSADAPEWVKREFMRQLWDCEDCRNAMLKGGVARPH